MKILFAITIKKIDKFKSATWFFYANNNNKTSKPILTSIINTFKYTQ